MRNGQRRDSGGDTQAQENYALRLQSWLETHKQYPRQAMLRRQEGVVLLQFVIDRQGRVISHRIDQSSGHRLLDNEVQLLIQRAQPLPPMPDHIPGDRFEVLVPVSFALG